MLFFHPGPACRSGSRDRYCLGLLAGRRVADLHRQGAHHGSHRGDSFVGIHPQFSGYAAGCIDVSGRGRFSIACCVTGFLAFVQCGLAHLPFRLSEKSRAGRGFGHSGRQHTQVRKRRNQVRPDDRETPVGSPGRDDPSPVIYIRRSPPGISSDQFCRRSDLWGSGGAFGIDRPGRLRCWTA